MPHVWLGDNNSPISTLDVTGKGKFTIITGIGGESWVESAKEVGEKLGIEIKTVLIGPDRDYTDLYGEWADAREIEESGCLLVRPDFHVAFRANEVTENTSEQLENALKSILGK